MKCVYLQLCFLTMVWRIVLLFVTSGFFLGISHLIDFYHLPLLGLVRVPCQIVVDAVGSHSHFISASGADSRHGKNAEQ